MLKFRLALVFKRMSDAVIYSYRLMFDDKILYLNRIYNYNNTHSQYHLASKIAILSEQHKPIDLEPTNYSENHHKYGGINPDLRRERFDGSDLYRRLGNTEGPITSLIT